jgi:hypothetical protein
MKMCGPFCSAEFIQIVIIVLMLAIVGLAVHHFHQIHPHRLGRFLFPGLLIAAIFFLLVLIVLRYAAPPATPSVIPSTSTPTVPDLFSLLLGVMGVIITVLTGLSITSAWRALDEARDAQERAERANTAMAARSLDIARLFAFIEADDRAHQARATPGMRRETFFRTELVRLFFKSDLTELFELARILLSRREIFLEIGPEGRRFFESLQEQSGLSRDDKRTLRQILEVID